jgi:hypothetical protein
MPHVPDSAHETHDRELIAAYAAGDAAADRLDDATAMVASCGGCAQLHRDLRSIAQAVHELPAPVRPRDFRITGEQATTLRPRGFRAFLAALSGPRFSFASPIGAGLLRTRRGRPTSP